MFGGGGVPVNCARSARRLGEPDIGIEGRGEPLSACSVELNLGLVMSTGFEPDGELDMAERVSGLVGLKDNSDNGGRSQVMTSG